jgi:predicted amidophosphoribosyltransferase
VAIRDLAALLVPPLCATCGAGCGRAEVLCARCAAALRAMPILAGRPPPGLDACWSSAAHDGVARTLVFALKFRSLLPVAALMAERIDRLAPPTALEGSIVPVPTAQWRGRRRGFDPALELGRQLASLRAAPLDLCLARLGSARQVGRTRLRRIREPPRFRVRATAPERVVLVDDVVTTGATLRACADVLRAAGAVAVSAVTFARTP